MAVVIGEVEVMPTEHRGSGNSAEASEPPTEGGPLDPIALQRALQALQEQALRNWSH